jgi:hypothetical protein
MTQPGRCGHRLRRVPTTSPVAWTAVRLWRPPAHNVNWPYDERQLILFSSYKPPKRPPGRVGSPSHEMVGWRPWWMGLSEAAAVENATKPRLPANQADIGHSMVLGSRNSPFTPT